MLLYTGDSFSAQPVYDRDTIMKLTSEGRLAADVAGMDLRHADFADVPRLGNERTAWQRTVEVGHFNLIVSYNRHNHTLN